MRSADAVAGTEPADRRHSAVTDKQPTGELDVGAMCIDAAVDEVACDVGDAEGSAKVAPRTGDGPSHSPSTGSCRLVRRLVPVGPVS